MGSTHSQQIIQFGGRLADGGEAEAFVGEIKIESESVLIPDSIPARDNSLVPGETIEYRLYLFCNLL